MRIRQMRPLSGEEIEKAFNFWVDGYVCKEDDLYVRSTLNLDRLDLSQRGWLQRARENLYLSGSVVAERLKVSRVTLVKYEKSERDGTVSIEGLRRVAEAMDCELIYFLRPKNKKTYSDQIWDRLLIEGQKHPWLQICDIRRRPRALAAICERLAENPKFRKQQGWSQRAKLIRQ